MQNSDHTDITKIYDSSGNACGFDKAKDHHLLYMQTYSKPYKSVCVKSCPKFDYNAIKYEKPHDKEVPVEENGYPGPMYFKEFAKDYAGLSHTKNPDMDEKEAFSYNADFANGYYTE